mmetsp:Transcript_15120/g.35879  ORF Transcript_15120/g.35879 Transcript_15120/m.35879 type:complete len:201 (-) Transcript_15120:972-1574(-)
MVAVCFVEEGRWRGLEKRGVAFQPIGKVGCVHGVVDAGDETGSGCGNRRPIDISEPWMRFDLGGAVVAEAVLGILHEQTLDKVDGLGGRGNLVLIRPLHLVEDGLFEDGLGRVGDEGGQRGEEFEQTNTERPPVGLVSVGFAEEDLRGEVLGGAHTRQPTHLVGRDVGAVVVGLAVVVGRRGVAVWGERGRVQRRGGARG